MAIEIIDKITTIGRILFRNLLYGTPAIANPPITDATVGANKFIIPAAVANAVTIRDLSILAKSAIGASIGIDAVAKPDVEGIKKDKGRYTTKATNGNMTPGTECKICSPALIIVAII